MSEKGQTSFPHPKFQPPFSRLLAALLFVTGALTSSCSKETDDTPSRSIKDFLRGRWRSGCLPHSNGDSLISDAHSRTRQFSFNVEDGWVFDEYYIDAECKTPVLRVVFAGTYSLGAFWKAGTDQATSLDFSFATVNLALFDDKSVQSANSAALCGGGYSINSFKQTPIADCQFASLSWGPRPNTIIRLEAGGLRPGEYTAQRHGVGPDFRPNTFDPSILLVRQ